MVGAINSITFHGTKVPTPVASIDVLNHVLSLLYVGMHQISRFGLDDTVKIFHRLLHMGMGQPTSNRTHVLSKGLGGCPDLHRSQSSHRYGQQQEI
ncbi:uncharacterized protein LOC114419179 isoform X2 [Glycine soja]|uniref:uncharacterized protein LOC114419179 isoform X2 n=1 Tax=Glycine soja TaxID=3848 RepID=UPI0010388C24|nr:uncharacterized protein LOC114419179 isoform X2 [Glycine soja]